MNDTQKWLRYVQMTVFPESLTQPPVTKDYVKTFYRKSTVLNELMINVSPDYISSFVNRTYDPVHITKHVLKSFVILDYPLVALETVFSDEYASKVRGVQAGLYPFKYGREINAGSCLSPSGAPVVFFSEWLFAFLWDFFHETCDIFPPGTALGKGTRAQQEAAREVKDAFCKKLSAGVYNNWDIDLITNSTRTTNQPKYETLFALIFIWAHELAHIFLGHCKPIGLLPLPFTSHAGSRVELRTYNISQEQECDADMFASDVYFAYMTRGPTFQDAIVQRSAIATGLEFLHLLALGEERAMSKDWSTDEHPLSAFRLLNICLRHRKLLSAFGWGDLYERLEKAAGQGSPISKYDYTKDLGTRGMLRYCPEAT